MTLSPPRAEAALRLIAAGCPDPVGTALAALGDPSATTTAVALRREPKRWQDDPEFMAFWTLYPHKIAPGGRYGAWGAFKTARRITSLAEILDGLRAYPFKSDPSSQPHPSTWLNQERWNHVQHTAPVTVAASVYRAGGLDLFMQSAKPGEDAGETYRRKMDELNDRAAGRLIDADEDDPDTAGLLDLEPSQALTINEGMPSKQVVAVLWGIDP